MSGRDIYHAWEGRMFIGTPEVKRPHRKSRRRWKDNVEIDLKKKHFVTV
jgi:hypothetical protein